MTWFLEVLKLTKALKHEKQEFEKIKNQKDCLKVSSEVLLKRILILEKENKYLEIKLRLKDEEISDFLTYNKPLEKAYRSLQRKYQSASDRLERQKNNDDEG